ncbi:hypothetical protein [Mucilaginibacter gracilis]|uniref:hypothetical protein n=1 Tax=Mucilaginibacter gracilis TaxID=423350 RepID=UPI001B88453D|nr:hypothetical protein [Mucilaginibacter gracilis]
MKNGDNTIRKADQRNERSRSSRIVNGHTGELLYVNGQLRSPSPNAYVNADMTDVHAYPDPMMSVKQPGKAQVCGEFGGIGVFIPDHQWQTGSSWVISRKSQLR